MQNTMLDTVVSSNSQELFDFNAEHNGEACIESLRPEDRGTERQFWFTVAMMCVIFECSADTIRRRVETLVNTGDINETQNCVSLTNVQAFGYNTTTLYDLTVFNKLAMTFIDNQRAVEIRAKFNDVLVKHETQVQPEMSDAEIMSRALEIAHRTLANREERIKALTAERDEAIRTKAQIGSRREATAMNTASQKSKECAKLTAENAELKDAVGRGTNWRTVNMMTAEWKREFGHAPSYHKLRLFSADLPKDMQPVKDVEVKVVLQNGSEKVNLLTRYHREAWAKYREYEENLRVSAESRRDASNEGIGLNDTDTDLEVF